MTTPISDGRLLRAVRLDALTTYLRAQGWQPDGSWGPYATAWTRTPEDEYELIVPQHADVADYVQRVSDILTTLSEVEARSQLAIYAALTDNTPYTDLVRFRAMHPDADDGSIPLTDGIKLFTSVQDMLVAAATVVDNKRASLPHRKPNAAVSYMENARIGQTERGSYILVIHSPFDPSDTQPSDVDQQPYGRRVVQTLVQTLLALQSISQVVDPDGAGETVLETRAEAFVEQGGSIEFCKAVSDLNESTQEQTVEISVDWSNAVPAPPEFVAEIAVTTGMAQVSRRLNKTLERQSSTTEKTIRGRVIRLAQGGDDSIATVTIDGDVDAKRRRIRLEVRNQKDHDLLIRAYQEKKLVACKGLLVKRGRFTYLKSYSPLQMINS